MTDHSTPPVANAAPKQRQGFRKGQSGNPAGRAAGSRNKVLLALDQTATDAAGGLLQVAIIAAQGGDMRALDLILARAWPVRRGRPMTLPDMPTITTAADLPLALARVVEAVTNGEITSEEAQNLGALLEVQRRAIETAELENRIIALEARR